MKTALLGLMALTAVSSASAASVGGYAGTDAGLYYQTDLSGTSAMRYSINALNLFSGGSIGVGGEVAYLNNISGQSLGGLAPYYGLGLGAGVSLGSSTGVSLYPHGLLGLRYNVAGPFSVFAEGNAGVRVGIGTGGGVRVGAGARIGLDYRIR
ncbi:hypothetical protein [Deinococcus phoenicis]|nr:hypothetical protein [Deinococcus phoenicis]